MIYEEYYKKHLKIKEIKKDINDLNNKKINLINMVDVQAITPKNNNGGSNIKEDKMLFYTAELEDVELNLVKKKNVIKELKEQLKELECELRESNELLDKVYLYKYVDKLKWYQICKKISYEKTQTYEFINKIDEILRKIKTTEKNGKI